MCSCLLFQGLLFGPILGAAGGVWVLGQPLHPSLTDQALTPWRPVPHPGEI